MVRWVRLPQHFIPLFNSINIEIERLHCLTQYAVALWHCLNNLFIWTHTTEEVRKQISCSKYSHIWITYWFQKAPAFPVGLLPTDIPERMRNSLNLISSLLVKFPQKSSYRLDHCGKSVCSSELTVTQVLVFRFRSLDSVILSRLRHPLYL